MMPRSIQGLINRWLNHAAQHRRNGDKAEARWCVNHAAALRRAWWG